MDRFQHPKRRSPDLLIRVAAIGILFALVTSASSFFRPVPLRAGAQVAPRPNIILIVVDALRADHISSYGYERPTTPNLDAFMAGGARFAEATSASSWTFPSNATLLTGRMPRRIRMNDWASLTARVPAEELTLAEALKSNGYQTIAFVNSFFVDKQFGLNQGFDHYQRLSPSGPAAAINELAFDWLDANPAAGQSQPLFLFMYFYDPHTWYDPPAPFDTLYDSTYTGSLTPEVYQHGEKVVSGEIVPTARDVEHLIALYDGEITYWDQHFAQFINRLSAEGLLNNAVVVLTADHGQMFGEHGKWVHRNSLYEEVLRIPLYVRFSGVVPPGTVIDTPVFNGDVMPTVLDLAGLPVPSGMDGGSLKPLLLGISNAMADRPIYAEMEAETDPDSLGYWIAPRYDLRSVKDDDWKYVMQIDNPQGDALYQIDTESVFEGQNLIASFPTKAGALSVKLHDWFKLPTDFGFLPSVRFR